jgi:hypothetical protein
MDKIEATINRLQEEIHLAEYVDSNYCENVSIFLLRDALDLILSLKNFQLNMPKAALILDEIPDTCFEPICGRRHWICPVHSVCKANKQWPDRPSNCPLFVKEEKDG